MGGGQPLLVSCFLIRSTGQETLWLARRLCALTTIPGGPWKAAVIVFAGPFFRYAVCPGDSASQTWPVMEACSTHQECME